jgi:hypothetical protein
MWKTGKVPRPLKRAPEGLTYRAALAAGAGTLVHVEGGALTPNMAAVGNRRDGLLLLLALERQRLESLQPGDYVSCRQLRRVWECRGRKGICCLAY